MTAVMCASGARSPDAPTDPCTGSSGQMSRASRASSCSITSRRTPEAPRPSEAIFSAMVSRTMRFGVGSPTPQQCDRIRLRCKVAVSAGAMRFEASLPKPVLTP